MDRFSEKVVIQELGATLGLCSNHVTAHTFGTRSDRNPCDGELCCTRADLGSIR